MRIKSAMKKIAEPLLAEHGFYSDFLDNLCCAFQDEEKTCGIQFTVN